MGNGMKSGSGTDPFEDFDGDEDGSAEAESEAQKSDTADDPTDSTDRPATTPTETSSSSGDASSSTSTSGGVGTGSTLPYRYARDSAKDQRDMVQFFLQADTKRLETRATADLGDLLGEDPLTLDVREAAYQVALEQHLEDVADKLREWGYDHD